MVLGSERVRQVGMSEGVENRHSCAPRAPWSYLSKITALPVVADMLSIGDRLMHGTLIGATITNG